MCPCIFSDYKSAVNISNKRLALVRNLIPDNALALLNLFFAFLTEQDLNMVFVGLRFDALIKNMKTIMATLSCRSNTVIVQKII